MYIMLVFFPPFNYPLPHYLLIPKPIADAPVTFSSASKFDARSITSTKIDPGLLEHHRHSHILSIFTYNSWQALKRKWSASSPPRPKLKRNSTPSDWTRTSPPPPPAPQTRNECSSICKNRPSVIMTSQLLPFRHQILRPRLFHSVANPPPPLWDACSHAPSRRKCQKMMRHNAFSSQDESKQKQKQSHSPAKATPSPSPPSAHRLVIVTYESVLDRRSVRSWDDDTSFFLQLEWDFWGRWADAHSFL